MIETKLDTEKCEPFLKQECERINNMSEKTNISSVRTYNIGNSDYSKHTIQPWDIWKEYHLNPWDADIIKRVLRVKSEPGIDLMESRKMDYQKIIHICQERINQIDEGYKF